jgi:serine/threonine protein kinase
MTPDLRDQLQHTLGASYTLERELGGGGMSRVFVAEDTALGRSVVVKVLPPEMASGVSIERFKREITLAARLQHPHIVPLLSAGETGGLPYFTMPFVEGESLRARLARGEEVPLRAAVHLLREVASALAYAHRKGVIHRRGEGNQCRDTCRRRRADGGRRRTWHACVHGPRTGGG